MTEAERSGPSEDESAMVTSALLYWLMALVFLSLTGVPGVQGDCWLIEGEKGFVWLAICSQNQPPYENIPVNINSTTVDLRLNDNMIRNIYFSSLSRFSNLTFLNLTKNDISYIEDGAFSAQFNLQVLQIGFNKLRNITEGMLRGLGRLQYLYLQANLIETVTTNAFWECPAIENIDLSMNRIQHLDGTTFRGLSKLTTCELYANPFSCSCKLLGFLRWLAAFPNQTSERMACDTPTGLSGYRLLSHNPKMPRFRNALHTLSSLCTDNKVTPHLYGSSDGSAPTMPDLSPCGLDDCSSGTFPEETISIVPADARPVMKLKEATHTTVIITIQIPNPFRKMYVLVLYNNSFFTDVQNLKLQREEIELQNLKSHINYTYCVASIRNSLRFNHTCLTISTGPGTLQERVASDSTASHYIMTLLGGLFGTLIVVGVAFHCARKHTQQEEPKSKKLQKMKRNLIEMKNGTDTEGGTISQLTQKQILSTSETVQRKLYLPTATDTDQCKIQDISGTPKTAKENYMEVRSEASDRSVRDCSAAPSECSQGSAAEIATIAKEVEKVNQIINNCIDALKSDSSSFQAVKSGGVSTAEPQSVLLSEHPTEPGFLPPVYTGGYRPPLQRHHSMDAPPKRAHASPGSSLRRSESKYTEKTSPLDESEILRAEAEQIQQYSEHRHSYPGPHHMEESTEGSKSQKSSILEPLTLSNSQLSPLYHHLSDCSSPEYSCRASLSLWERFKLQHKRHRHEEESTAAGHALRRKVQFAKDEDLHDILDYWKKVSAQQKS